MIRPSARRPTLLAGALAMLTLVSCSVYTPSLLGAGAAGSAGAAAQPGSAGSAGDAGAGEGGSAGEPSVSSGAGGGLAGAGGVVDTAGTTSTAGTSSGGGGAPSTAGAGSGGTLSGGAAGTGGSAGSAGAGATANGCAKLSVPLAAATDKAHFVVALTSPVDLSKAVISMRLYVRAGSGGSIFNYVQDSGTYHFFGVATAQRAALSGLSGWSTITWDVGAQADSGSSGIVKTSIKNIGIEIGAQPSLSWTNPTIVYIDSISVNTPASSYTFDASSSVSPTATTSAPSGQVLWINSGATDTTAVGVTLSWQASCP